MHILKKVLTTFIKILEQHYSSRLKHCHWTVHAALKSTAQEQFGRGTPHDS
jgi:hypothetical protein